MFRQGIKPIVYLKRKKNTEKLSIELHSAHNSGLMRLYRRLDCRKTCGLNNKTLASNMYQFDMKSDVVFKLY